MRVDLNRPMDDIRAELTKHPVKTRLSLTGPLVVARDIADQLASGSRRIFGVMVESHLCAGAQKFTPGQDDPAKLAYGQSITDACLGWDDSAEVLKLLSQAVAKRRG